jgi:hypothetical protein
LTFFTAFIVTFALLCLLNLFAWWVDIFIYMYTCMYTCVYFVWIYMYIYTFISYGYMYICVYFVWIYVYMCLFRMDIYVYVHIHVEMIYVYGLFLFSLVHIQWGWLVEWLVSYWICNHDCRNWFFWWAILLPFMFLLCIPPAYFYTAEVRLITSHCWVIEWNRSFRRVL